MKIEFQIEFMGERAAGLMPYSATAKVEIDPDPIESEFVHDLTEALRGTLADMYDGAKVMTKAEYDAYIDQLAARDEEMGELA